MTQARTTTDHHHGDLKNALIDAGLALLEEGGINALSLRKCAARAGVSHAAPAHHFDGLDGLKRAIASRAFQSFTHEMIKARDAGPQCDEGRLNSICLGYLRFGLTHPGLLSIIFAAGGLSSFGTLTREDGESAYMVLRTACAPFQPEDQPPELLELHVWSLAHGFTQLALAGEFGPVEDEATLMGLADQVFGLLKPLITRPAP